jgi:hypothetical protein
VVILTPWKREAPGALDEANDAVVARIDAWLPGLDAPLSWVPVVADAPSPAASSMAEHPRAVADV